MFRTLLVDDDFLVRSYLKTLNAWEKAGYEVVKENVVIRNNVYLSNYIMEKNCK